MHRLRVVDYYPALLVHSIEMVNRADAASEGVGVDDRSGYIRFCQQNRLWKPSPSRQVTRHRSCESAACAVGGIRAQPVGFEYFLLNTS